MKIKETVYAIAEARSHFTDIIGQAAYGQKRILITRRNKPLVYVVSVEDVALLEALENTYDIEEAKNILQDIKRKDFVSWDSLKAELKL
jgi:prevent-host-death family protein